MRKSRGLQRYAENKRTNEGMTKKNKMMARAESGGRDKTHYYSAYTLHAGRERKEILYRLCDGNGGGSKGLRRGASYKTIYKKMPRKKLFTGLDT